MGLPASNVPERAALEGRLSAVSLFDLCQFLMLNRKTGNLTVRTGARVAYFTFRSGQLLTALDESLREGEGVVLQAVQWTDGTFEFNPGPVAAERCIEASTENLLLEAARQLDEMRAEPGAMESDGEDSREQSFLRTQAKAANLSDAFREAMASDAHSGAGSDWKETLLRRLETPGEIDRVLLTADDRVHVVTSNGTETLREIPTAELTDWKHEIEGALRKETRSPRVGRITIGGLQLWVSEEVTPEGALYSLAQPSRRLPSWEELGLTEDIAHSIYATESLPILIGALNAGMAQAALAAWLSRRARARAAVGWVVESWPRYDWSALPGRVGSYPAGWLTARGDLGRLVDSTGAEILAFRGVRSPFLLEEAFALAAEGVRVLLLAHVDSLPQALRALESMAGGGRTGTELGRAIGGVWLVRRGSDASGLPWQSGFLRAADLTARESAARG